MTQKYFNLIFQWAFFFYLIFLIQTTILFTYDANSFGTLNKWRFIQPTYISFAYVLLSILAFSIAYAFSYYAMRSFSSNKKYFPKPFARNASLTLKSIYFSVCLAYIFLGTLIFQDNYRLDNSFVSMITMLPLNTIIWSIALILILVRNQSNNKNDLLILLGILSLLTNISGVGSFTIALALTILFFLSNNHLDFKRFLIFLLAGLLFITSILIFTLVWKYNFDFLSIRFEDVYLLLGWVLQRLLIVPGSSIFLIENFFNSSPYFGINESFQIFLSNLGKIIGSNQQDPLFSSLGQYNFSIFYSGTSKEMAGASPGILGGAIFFLPWYLAATASGIFLFLIFLLLSLSWGRYLHNQSLSFNFIFFYFFINYLLLNPYSWFSVIDPGFIKFLIFLLSPSIFIFVNRITFKPQNLK